jgi:hypothetical protein
MYCTWCSEFPTSSKYHERKEVPSEFLLGIVATFGFTRHQSDPAQEQDDLSTSLNERRFSFTLIRHITKNHYSKSVNGHYPSRKCFSLATTRQPLIMQRISGRQERLHYFAAKVDSTLVWNVSASRTARGLGDCREQVCFVHVRKALKMLHRREHLKFEEGNAT